MATPAEIWAKIPGTFSQHDREEDGVQIGVRSRGDVHLIRIGGRLYLYLPKEHHAVYRIGETAAVSQVDFKGTFEPDEIFALQSAGQRLGQGGLEVADREKVLRIARLSCPVCGDKGKLIKEKCGVCGTEIKRGMTPVPPSVASFVESLIGMAGPQPLLQRERGHEAEARAGEEIGPPVRGMPPPRTEEWIAPGMEAGAGVRRPASEIRTEHAIGARTGHGMVFRFQKLPDNLKHHAGKYYLLNPDGWLSEINEEAMDSNREIHGQRMLRLDSKRMVDATAFNLILDPQRAKEIIDIAPAPFIHKLKIMRNYNLQPPFPEPTLKLIEMLGDPDYADPGGSVIWAPTPECPWHLVTDQEGKVHVVAAGRVAQMSDDELRRLTDSASGVLGFTDLDTYREAVGKAFQESRPADLQEIHKLLDGAGYPKDRLDAYIKESERRARADALKLKRIVTSPPPIVYHPLNESFEKRLGKPIAETPFGRVWQDSVEGTTHHFIFAPGGSVYIFAMKIKAGEEPRLDMREIPASWTGGDLAPQELYDRMHKDGRKLELDEAATILRRIGYPTDWIGRVMKSAVGLKRIARVPAAPPPEPPKPREPPPRLKKIGR